MKWRIRYSRQAINFLKRENIEQYDVEVLIVRGIKKLFLNMRMAVDIKKMKGGWKNYYRIRQGKIRIIVRFDSGERIAYVERIGWRGKVYR